jgi:mannose-6-phosphate isomerase-like protein (cupin superfamily)
MSEVRVLRIAGGEHFQMGNGENWRVVYPEMGAEHITLNYAIHQPGAEFTPHVHEHSEDVIVVLEGEGHIRSGEELIPFQAGDVLYVPAGVLHGTINTGEGRLVMFSCQAPPDPALYTGEKDRR